MLHSSMLQELTKADIMPLLGKGNERDDFINFKIQEPRGQLKSPYPSPLEYWHTIFDGFAKFPSRLDNFIEAKKNQNRGVFQNYKPFLIDLEPNSRCNFRCTMCQVSEWERGQRARDMSFDEFRSLKNLYIYVVEAKIHGMGEPLLHKNFFEMVEFLGEYSIWTRTSINGSMLLANNNIKKLVTSSLGEVQISLDGATKKTYEKIRVRANFEKVTDGIRQLNTALEEANRSLTRMWVVLQEENIHEISAFVELAINLRFKRLTFSLSLNDWGQEFWRSRNGAKGIELEKTIEMLEALHKESLDNGLEISLWKQSSKYSISDGTNGLCPWIFDRTYIGSDMRLTPCAIIGNPNVTDLGDANSILESWNGLEYMNFRKRHIEGDIPRECKDCYKLDKSPQKYTTPKQVFVDISQRKL